MSILTSRVFLFSWLAALVVLSGCSSANNAANKPAQKAEVLQSRLERIAAPQVEPADSQALADSNLGFALALYARLHLQESNVFYSPYSISEALAMVYAGTDGETQREMERVLQFSLPQARLHPAFNAIDHQLAAAVLAGQKTDADKGFQLSVANSIWGQAGFPFRSDYLDLLSLNYGAGLRTVDFAAAPEPARQAINDWVSQETKNKINDIIPQGAIQTNTRLVLANAIYFKAAWMYPFEKSLTQDKLFTHLDGAQVQAPRMSLYGKHLSYNQGDGYQAVELPYSNSSIAMLVLLPEAGKFASFDNQLDASQVRTILGGLQNKRVDLEMPKFRIEYEVGLSNPLKSLGMSAAFDPSKADFSGIDGQQDLYISDVLHKAYVNVDEQGTEAAAATVVIVGVTSMPVDEEPVRMTIDRPFIFLIYDHSTNTVLFIGRVLDPTHQVTGIN